MVATLTRVFGVHNLALAEDVVQDAFCRALEVWNFRGVPEDPQAWLMATAKNRALDVLRRQRTARAYALELRGLLESEGIIVQVVDELFAADDYHGASAEFAVRSGLCQEAMRLTAELLKHPRGAKPTTYALAALMAFSAARLPARVDAAGNLTSPFDQDRSLWDRELLVEGLKLLELSAGGSELTEYHLEAAIASVHSTAARTEETDWETIVSLYDTLMATHPSPIVALNRAIAIAQKDGPERGLEEIAAIEDRDRLTAYPFYWAAL